MDGLRNKTRQVRVFWDEVLGEMKKASWPERKELMESTVVVIVSVFLIALFVGVSDRLLVTFLRFIVPAR